MAETPGSQRAKEVARDLWDEIRAALLERGLLGRREQYHLDGSAVFLAQADAEAWVRESVDAGFPEVRFFVETAESDAVVINLAAFEDPDSQYWAPIPP